MARRGAAWVDVCLDRVIGPLVDWVVGGLVAALVILVGSGILARYVLNYSLAWSDELAGLGFVWLTLLGSVAASRRRTHMVIGFLPKLFGPTGQRAIGLYVMAAILIFCGFMVGEGIVLTAATIGDKSPVLRMPVGLSYLSLPVAGVFMFAYTLRQSWTLWQTPGGWAASGASDEED
ncbi:MAG TPA: TRAP transporter small permease [Candidatus Acidoferrum sp.]|nr:TRAP transporter small permease [Candidatus Acidoferrum sp.]